MGRIDYGMPALLENGTLEANIATCKENGLDFIELNVNLPEYGVQALENTDYFRQAAEANGIYYTLHLDEYLNFCDFNPIVAQAHLETVRRTIACAKKIGIPLLNMHMVHGVFMTLPERKVQMFEMHADRYLASFRRFREMCEAEIGDSDITIAVENLDGFRPIERKAIDVLLESNRFALTWDTGHTHITNYVDLDFITERRDRLRHFHLHDSIGKNDHRPLGTGEVDVTARLNDIRELNCRCLVEIKTAAALRESVEWLDKYGWRK